ncbi:MAG: hypothetical protein QW035_02770 [Candidatus Anstonellales archaeon]
MTEEMEQQDRFKELRDAFNALAAYPSITARKQAKAAIKAIKKEYNEGDALKRNFIIYTIHHNLARISEIKDMKSAEWARNVKKLEGEQVAPYVFSSVTSHFSSVEGAMALIDLLSELKGPLPSKVLAYHLSYYLMFQSLLFKLLRNRCLKALGEARSTYALSVLLSLAEAGVDEIERPLAEAISRWKERLEGSKSNAAKRWLSLIEGSFGAQEKKEGPYF